MKKITKYIMISSIILFSLMIPKMSLAKTLIASGTGASDARIFDNQGQNVTGQDLNRWSNYEVKYHWEIETTESLQAGDQIEFILPQNIQVISDIKFDVINREGKIVGKFILLKGQRIGTLTFNNYFEDKDVTKLDGTLSFSVNGTIDDDDHTWEIIKSGWLDDNKTPHWTITYNPNENHLTNVTISDELIGDQKLNPNSIQIVLGRFDNGRFIEAETINNPIGNGLLEVTANGFVLKLAELHSALQIRYTTTLTNYGQIDIGNKVNSEANGLGNNADVAYIKVIGDGMIDADIHKPSTSSTLPVSKVNESSRTTKVSCYTKNSTDKPQVTTQSSKTHQLTKSSGQSYSNVNGSITKQSQTTTAQTRQTTSHMPSSASTELRKSHYLKTTAAVTSTNSTSDYRQTSDKLQSTMTKLTTFKRQFSLPQTSEKRQVSLLILGIICIISSYLLYRKHKNWI